ncbi:MAG: hypothetical protein ABI621_00595 [Chloroflexota bacterium]
MRQHLNLDRAQRQKNGLETATRQRSAKDALKQDFKDLMEGFKLVLTIPWTWTHTLQEMVPGEMLGRVYSIDALGSFVLHQLGSAFLAGQRTCLVRRLCF